MAKIKQFFSYQLPKQRCVQCACNPIILFQLEARLLVEWPSSVGMSTTLPPMSRHNVGTNNLLIRIFMPFYDEIWFQCRDKFQRSVLVEHRYRVDNWKSGKNSASSFARLFRAPIAFQAPHR